MSLSSGTMLRTGSWALYDLANTVYAATIAYVFVPAFIANSGSSLTLGLANTGSMVVAGLIVPLL